LNIRLSGGSGRRIEFSGCRDRHGSGTPAALLFALEAHRLVGAPKFVLLAALVCGLCADNERQQHQQANIQTRFHG
jgi:hypothetical protein